MESDANMPGEAPIKLSSNLDAIARKVQRERYRYYELRLNDLIRWLIFLIIAAGAVIYTCNLIMSFLYRAESISEWIAPP